MKNDLATSIIATVIGAMASFFLVNSFFDDIESVTVNSVDPNLTINMAEPDPDIFNFKSVNPTVEVYVGGCDDFDEETGECIEENEEVEDDFENEEDQENP